MKRNFVAIENAANSSSVALLQVAEDEQFSLSGRVNKAEQQHAEHILPMLDELLHEAQLAKQAIHGVVFSQGPGAFTGLRIACGVAQGLALGLGIDVVAVDSLRATASMVPNKPAYDLIVSVLDARMQEVYLAAYQPVAGAAQIGNELMMSAQLHTVQAPVLIGVADVIPWLREKLIPGLQAQLKVGQASSEGTTQEQATQEQGAHKIALDGAENSTATLQVLLCGNALDEYAQEFAQGLVENQGQVEVSASAANQDRAEGDSHAANLGFDSVANSVQANSRAIEFHLGHTAWPSAEVLVQLGYEEFKQGRAMAAELVAPLYLRDKVAFTTAEREQGMGGNPKAELPQHKHEFAAVASTASAQTSEDIEAQLSNVDARIDVMQVADIEAVLEIENQVQLEPWTAGMFADSLQANYKAGVLRHRSGQIMGYALQMFAPDVAHLLTIAIAPEWQQQGLGRLLLTWTEQQVLEAGLSAQMLEVRVSNQAARALYEAQSYQQIGLRKGYYKGVDGQSEDALVLQKNLL
ncbi:MAG: tRNA (adenosine(37)-N6)-threonylcarbamoyltransferase complex dimerization subunit type 1 TsaB [Pelistega sp.]|nr:tRNA (adenosine(37)-N6)-threonylcarbamoyltransferase complex dimerization subunit type 1 TsaB [Pelistega sp.]